ncbi:hypothetical protein OEZ85_011187 [Tetradesmus obliquus]|uniref:Uncharacterized protein n=1 Tax=Tetradesmus obliquus TaxID=3088 RepID=A0ABY8TPI5_TETOB|nr:hypothetical protein OEZ85_011187 [Tetradesmus obliquus]
MELAVEAGDFARALKLHNTVQGLKGVEQHHMMMRVGSVYEGSIGGRLRRACAAGDAAAVAQLERLAGFARHTFFSIKLTLQQPELLRNLLGGFHGRAVTPGTLAAELGLPWALLQRLLMQRADTIQAQFVVSRTPEAQQMQRDELLEAVQHTLTLAQDQAATAQQLRFAASRALITAMNVLQVDDEAAADASAAAGAAGAGRTTPLQRLLGDAGFVTGPPVTPQPPRLPWGRLVAQAAVELRRQQLLAWMLQPEQRQRLWGSADNAAKAALVDLMRQDCTPISNAVSRQPEQQRADLLQLQTHQRQLLPGRPAFAELAAETAVLLLDVTPNDEGLLSDWLQHGLHPGSSAADLARAKAVLAAVVAATQLPAGAKLVHRDCLWQVQRLGDVDLLALVVLWGHRVPQDVELP